ncbi:MAG: translation initiation factor IF-3 [Alphaproteobacteria bacterium]|nr:translation initiation factor IF-3 [Alphaproteobacteria bacterium]
MRVNNAIRSPRVRLIDENGDMVGVVTTQEALRRAEIAGLDLVEVAPQNDPPVCKILDYGKYKYEQQKKMAAVRKNQKVIEIKEIKLRPSIEENDYQVKLKNMHRFFEGGDKVKVSMRFKGREIAHQDIGMALLKRMCADLEEIAKVEQDPKFEGKQVIMLLSPR